MPTPSINPRGGALRAARLQRVRGIRRRVVASSLALFVGIWMLITLLLVTGHDPALAKTAAKTAAVAGQSTTTSATATTGASGTNSSTPSSTASNTSTAASNASSGSGTSSSSGTSSLTSSQS